MSAEDLEREAEEIITRSLLNLPEGRQSGTAKRLVRVLVDASLERLKAELVAARAKVKK